MYQDGGDHLGNFIDGEMTWEKYLENQAKHGTFADHVSIVAALDYLQCNLSVINTHPDNPVIEIVRNAEWPMLHVAHIPEVHYECVLPLCNQGKLIPLAEQFSFKKDICTKSLAT